jgi:hypothetical protein
MIVTCCRLFAAIVAVAFLACPRFALVPSWIVLVHPIFRAFETVTSAVGRTTNFKIRAAAISIFTQYVFCVMAVHVSVRAIESFATSFCVCACFQVVLLDASSILAHDQLGIHLENVTIGRLEGIAARVDHTARLSVTIVALKAEAKQAFELRLMRIA